MLNGLGNQQGISNRILHIFYHIDVNCSLCIIHVRDTSPSSYLELFGTFPSSLKLQDLTIITQQISITNALFLWVILTMYKFFYIKFYHKINYSRMCSLINYHIEIKYNQIPKITIESSEKKLLGKAI